MRIQISGWRVFLRAGEAYHRCARQAVAKGRTAFTPTILYNLIAMAIEKYIMAFLMYHGDLAQNHTMADLAEAFERHAGLQPELRRELLFLDRFQEICDQDRFHCQPPAGAELERMFRAVGQLEEFVRPRLAGPAIPRNGRDGAAREEFPCPH